jgi:hypothetical protein
VNNRPDHGEVRFGGPLARSGRSPQMPLRLFREEGFASATPNIMVKLRCIPGSKPKRTYENACRSPIDPDAPWPTHFITARSGAIA